MAGGSPQVYNSAKAEFFNGTQDWDTDNHYAVLVSSSYTPSLTHSTFADVSTYEVSAAGKQDMSNEVVTPANNEVIMDADGVEFDVDTYTAKYVIVIQGTAAGSASTDRLVCYSELNEGSTLSATSESIYVNWDLNDGVFKLGAATATNPFGLTESQEDNLLFFWRPAPLNCWKRNSTTAGDVSPPFVSSVTNNDLVDKLLNGAPNQVNLNTSTSTVSPYWDDTLSFATHGVVFDGGDRMQIADSTKFLAFLHDDSVDYTLLFQIAINEALASGPGTIFTTRSTTGSTKGVLLNYGGGANDLQYLIHDGTSSDRVGETTWSGFAQDTIYNLMVTHTAGGATALYRDNLGTALDSGTLTSTSSGDSTGNATVAAYADGSAGGVFTMTGAAIIRGAVLTESAAQAYFDAIDAAAQS